MIEIQPDIVCSVRGCESRSPPLRRRKRLSKPILAAFQMDQCRRLFLDACETDNPAFARRAMCKYPGGPHVASTQYFTDTHMPLYHASALGKVNIVRVLLDLGFPADLPGSKTDLRPLYIACHNGHNEVVDLLLSFGADPHREGIFGETPLLLAARQGHVHVLRTMGFYGIDLTPVLSDQRSSALHDYVRYTLRKHWCPMDFALDARSESEVRWLIREKLAVARPGLNSLSILAAAPHALALSEEFKTFVHNICLSWSPRNHKQLVHIYGQDLDDRIMRTIMVLQRFLIKDVVLLIMEKYVAVPTLSRYIEKWS